MKTKDFFIMAIEAALMVGALLAIGFYATLWQEGGAL